MTREQYYTAPSDEVFDDIKQNAIKIWQSYDDTYGYATSKIDRIKDIANVQDNAWYIVAMFDIHNQRKLLTMVTPETARLIADAMDTGGKDGV